MPANHGNFIARLLEAKFESQESGSPLIHSFIHLSESCEWRRPARPSVHIIVIMMEASEPFAPLAYSYSWTRDSDSHMSSTKSKCLKFVFALLSSHATAQPV